MKKFILIAISVMTFFAFSITSFAAEEVPKFTPTSGGKYVTVYSSTYGQYFTYAWSSSSDISVYVSNLDQIHYIGNGALHKYEYRSSDSTWTSLESWTLSDGHGKIFGGQDLKRTNITIYDLEDNSVVVFPLPPSLSEVTEESLQEMTTNLGQTASIVTLCGVGCLALLIGLNLLRRKSVIFLNR